MTTYTINDVPALRESYSDCFKSLHNFRPRGILLEDEYILRFFNSYEEEYKAAEEQEARELEALSEEHGQEFKTMSEYLDFAEAQWEKGFKERNEARTEAARIAVAMKDIRNPLVMISMWEFGDI